VWIYLLGTGYDEVSPIGRGDTCSFQLLFQACVSDGRRAHIYATPVRAVISRGADDPYGPHVSDYDSGD
jgi:hypothetical protein